MPPPRPQNATRDAVVDGPTLARALAGGAAAVAQQADAINVINVFPVPDGDTGTNMAMTMRATAAAAAAASGSAADVARAAADAALMGAKGNSGVILSQILAGFTQMPAGSELGAAALAAGLERGRDAAYHVVSQPREGTILTAISEAARAARSAVSAGAGIEEAFAAAVDAARDAVANTPNLLPVLKEAGVVDSGAQGLYVVLDGMLRTLRGEPLPASFEGGHIDEAWLRARERLHGDEGEGFCTEFVVRGDALDRETVRHRLAEMGESVLVIGSEGLLRAHLHTKQPDVAFAYARTLGEVSHEKADDMQAQISALASRTPPSDGAAAPPAVRLGVVAVGAGDGIEALLRSIGAAAVVSGGQTMNPSAGEIVAAIEATGAREVIVLPDNKNIILAAEQAADALRARGDTRRVAVVPTRSVPQGVAALVALNIEASLEENLTAMADAVAHISSGEVTRAIRNVTIDGHAVHEGQAIAIIDGRLDVAADSIEGVVRSAVARMVAGRDAPLVTLYHGEGASEAGAEALAEELRSAHACEVEVIAGGQPHYPYLIGVDS